jgi:hypothetical protein
MENTATMTAAMPVAQEATKASVKQKEHWLVEVVSGYTVATTMVSALALFYVFLSNLPTA